MALVERVRIISASLRTGKASVTNSGKDSLMLLLIVQIINLKLGNVDSKSINLQNNRRATAHLM